MIASIRVRPFHPDDADALVSVFRSAVRVVARRDYTHEQTIAWAPDVIDSSRWKTHYASRPTWVAQIDATVAGFTDLEPDGHLDMLFVHADFQKRGVASALLAHLESAAQRLGIDHIYTEASITARPFFERRGFDMLAQQVVSIRGLEFINFRMRKALVP